MPEEPTTLAVQRYLNALSGDAPAEPIVRRSWTARFIDSRSSAPTSSTGVTHA